MRLFLLPITRRKLQQQSSNSLLKTTTTVSSPHTPPKPFENLAPAHVLLYAQRLNRTLSPKTSLLERITARASKTWTSWESRESGWQKKVTDWGNTALSRIPYQEWGLKSIPPLSARRKIAELQWKGAEKRADGEEATDGAKVEVLYPNDLLSGEEATSVLERLATEREGYHRRWMWACILGTPFTAPVALIPVIPNLPFFYLVFRGWSHWRALAGSKHIQFLIEKRLTKTVPSGALQQIYDVNGISKEKLNAIKNRVKDMDVGIEREKIFAEALLSASSKQVPEEPLGTKDSRIIVSKTTGRLISFCFGVPQVDVEMERAAAQVGRLLAKEDGEKKEKEFSDEKGEGPSSK